MEAFTLHVQISLDNDSKVLVKDLIEALKCKTTAPAPQVTPSAPQVAPSAPQVAPSAPQVAPSAPETKIVYSDEMMADITKKAVAAVKQRGQTTAFIRIDIFEKKYNCSKSTGCAPELREALYNDLAALIEDSHA